MNNINMEGNEQHTHAYVMEESSEQTSRVTLISYIQGTTNCLVFDPDLGNPNHTISESVFVIIKS